MSTPSKPSFSSSLPEWATVKKPQATGIIKVNPEDFVVEEELGFELGGQGEHVWLYVEKTGLNTLDLCNLLAKKINLSPREIAYSGLKDKQAVTKQWLSIHSTQELDYQQLQIPGARIIHVKRHISKLKRGLHRANHFEIIIRDLSGQRSIEQTIERVREEGVPNYFGAQRFGRFGKNIDKARAMFKGDVTVNRQQRGFYLSAARAFLFNEVLSERVKRDVWNKGFEGDVMMLAGTNSFFKTQTIDEVLIKRLSDFDIHPSVPLWGKGRLASSAETKLLEEKIVQQYPLFAQGLENYGLHQQRRASRLIAQDLEYEYIDGATLKLTFTLLKGAFATTVLRELLTINT